MDLSKTDYKKIVHLINNSYSTTLSDFLNKTQLLLSELFAFNNSMFWLSDSNGNMYNINFLNLPEKLISDYTEVYKNHDFMNPKKQKNYISETNKVVLKLADTIISNNFGNSEYYNFITRHEMIDQMVVYFADAEVINGGIGFARFKGDVSFNRKDTEILQVLSMHINQVIKSYLKIEEMKAESFFRNTKSNDNLGIIQIGENQSVSLYNEVAQEIIYSFDSKQSVEEFFIQSIYPKIPEDLSTLNKPCYIDLNEWTIKIVPEKNTRTNLSHKQFTIYMYEQKNENNDLQMLLSNRESEIYKLVLKGYTNDEISNQLWISINTVKKHLRNMYEKLDVSNRTSLIYKLKGTSETDAT